MKKSQIGEVVSNKMTKTVVVKVESKVKHPLYRKLITKTRKFKAHCNQEVQIGQKVRIAESKKFARDVHFIVLEVLK